MSVVFEIKNKDNGLKRLATVPAALEFNKAYLNNSLQNIPVRHKKQYMCLPFLLTFNMALIVCHFIFSYKLISMHFGSMSIGSIFIPFWAILDDVVAEVYGFKMFMRFFWAMWFVITIQAILYNLAFLPDAKSELQGQYQFVFQEMSNIPYYIYLIIASYISTRINGFLLIKWKILLNGKWFWLRSAGSSMLCDIGYLSLIIPAWISLETLHVKEIIPWITYSLIFRLFVYLLLAYPITKFVNLLKIIEGIDSYEVATLNPFSQLKKIGA